MATEIWSAGVMAEVPRLRFHEQACVLGIEFMFQVRNEPSTGVGAPFS